MKTPPHPIRPDLIEFLEEITKDPKIAPGYDKEEAMFLAGQKALIDKLRTYIPKSDLSNNLGE